MPKDKTHPKKAGRDAPARAAKAAPALKPSDGELRFQHLIRNMVVARDEARKTREQG